MATRHPSELAWWWDSIGKQAAAEWGIARFAHDRFPEIAADVLRANPPPDGDLASLALTWLSDSQLPHQHDLGSGFGQPAVTVYRDEQFIIYLLFWFDETLAIHDHRFNGAFAVLQGESLQNIYHFEREGELFQGVSTGTLTETTVEILGRGDVREIPAGDGLIHSNIHFGNMVPNLTLVVRTLVSAEDPQRTFSRSGISYLNNGITSQSAIRLQGFRAACRISPMRGAQYLEQAVASAAAEEAIALLTAAVTYFGSDLNLRHFLMKSEVLARLPDIHDLLVDQSSELLVGLEALDELRQLDDPQDRILMALIASATGPAKAARIIAAKENSADPPRAVFKSVLDLSRRVNLTGLQSRCELSPEAQRVIEQIMEGADPLAMLESNPAECRELAMHRMFGPMMRFALTSPS